MATPIYVISRQLRHYILSTKLHTTLYGPTQLLQRQWYGIEAYVVGKAQDGGQPDLMKFW